MDSNLIIGHAKFLYYSASNIDLMDCVKQSIDKLVDYKDICELNHDIGCSLDEFTQDIYSRLCKEVKDSI